MGVRDLKFAVYVAQCLEIGRKRQGLVAGSASAYATLGDLLVVAELRRLGVTVFWFKLG